MKEIKFTLVDHTVPHECRLIDTGNGTVTVWIPYGIELPLSEVSRVADLLKSVSQPNITK
jgi:hypothetical protein